MENQIKSRKFLIISLKYYINRFLNSIVIVKLDGISIIIMIDFLFFVRLPVPFN